MFYRDEGGRWNSGSGQGDHKNSCSITVAYNRGRLLSNKTISASLEKLLLDNEGKLINSFRTALLKQLLLCIEHTYYKLVLSNYYFRRL